MTHVTVQFVVSDDTHATALADHIRHAAAAFAASNFPTRTDAGVRVSIHHTQNPPATDAQASAAGAQLFDRVTGEEVVGRALSIPALSGFSSARHGQSRIELLGEHVYEVFEECALPVADPDTGSAIYVTVTGRKLTEDRVVVRATEDQLAGTT